MLVAVMYKPDDRCARMALRIEEILREYGHDVALRRAEVQRVEADLGVAVGGDGTLLILYHSVGRTPILGVKDGSYGLLMELEEESLEEGVRRIGSGRYFVAEEPAVSLEGHEDSLALNDILLAPRAVGKALRGRMFVDGVEINSFIADGVVFSTPLGSMAYCLSAGGPLVDPRVGGMIASILAPWPPSMDIPVRSLVIPQGSVVTVESDRDLLAAIDGQIVREVGRRCSVRLVSGGVRLAHLDRDPLRFYRRIVSRVARAKLERCSNLLEKYL
ncbi:MAG: hypothetical protein DRO06_00375 [Thermoproteota archaeon]|nr:MAG: hypothetical protein DRO06_00375 [Candidatus Korarchaeota archaeon]